MKKDVLAEITAAFVHGGTRIENLPEGDLKAAGMKIGEAFTVGVALLREWRNPAVRDLAAMIWDIVGHRIVGTAIGPEVPSLTLAAFGAKSAYQLAAAGSKLAPQAIIFTPHRWLNMIAENAPYQLGALVFVGSQAVDYYNGRVLIDPEALKTRARAYEAEYLISLTADAPEYKLNAYQREILEDFPYGLGTASVKPLLYKHKAFVPPA
jgi:hypothetical protein